MAGGKLDQWEDGTLAKGINLNQPDFSRQYDFTNATLNVTSGIFEGIGPRYGVSPIPGHNDNEVVIGSKYPGLTRSETQFGGAGVNSAFRKQVLGIIPIRMGGTLAAGINTISTYYAWIIGYTSTFFSGFNLIDVSISSKIEGGITAQSTNIYDGFFKPIPVVGCVGAPVEFVGGSNTILSGNKGTDLAALLNVGPLNFIGFAGFSVSGVNVQNSWLLGGVSSVGDATHAPSSSLTNSSGVTGSNNYGIPSEYLYGNFSTQNRTLLIYALTNLGAKNIDYSAALTPTALIYKPGGYFADGTTNIDLSGVTATKLAGGAGYANNAVALYNDPNTRCNSSYQGVLLASSNPVAIIIQDWNREGTSGRLPQYFDLCNAKTVPQNITNTYTESAQLVATAFSQWPAFVRGTPMAALAATGTQFGPANSGILRSNTVYEFTYSHYIKRLNFETNVGAPVKIQTGATDFISLQIFGVADTIFNAAVGGNSILPFLSGQTPGGSVQITNEFEINFLEYRFYFRLEGMQEWIPALFIDAAKYWFYPYNSGLAACTGGIGGTPGGRPGGFQDYSLLPLDKYTCVVMYKNRAFWISDKSLTFSLQNNMVAYPQRNSVACPVGSFKGGLVHAYYGQAQQDARLVVFSTNGTFVGKFTGQPLQVPVQVSIAATGVFPLDGSDFVLNAWTSVTAFSYRSAVVADGVLYFWGPQGVFMDNGVSPIERISLPLEPQIFTIYDPSLTDNIHCVYNSNTKEIIWFFTPKTSDSNPTHMLVWNTGRKTWLYTSYSGQIDAAQQLKIDTNIPTAGSRTVIFARKDASQTIQRAYFFDQNNLAGDMRPTTELIVKSFTSPSANVRRLTLAAGSASLATVNIGDLIATQQNKDYTNGALTTPLDFIAQVAAVNSGAGTVDITLPAGATTFDATATIANNYQFFPVWHAAGTNGVITGAGLNGFPYVIDTKFWIPGGMAYWGYWLYLHLLYKLNLILPIGTPLTQTLGYATPISSGTQSDIITLTNNSASNCQILHPLVPGNQNIEGQGLKITFSGFQLAGSWILQYLEAYAQMKDGMQLKLFEV